MSILTLVCVFGYSIGNVFLPAAIRAYFGQSAFGNSAFEYITYTGNGLFIFFLVFTTLLFFMAGIRDMKRRAYILNQLGQYLSPKKLQVYKDEKLLPTVNILD
jgi:membrane protease YdiL (CAAX protease family)